VVCYTFYTEGGQPNLGLISAFSLLYSVPVVAMYLFVNRALRVPLPRRYQALMADIVLSRLVKEYAGGVRAVDGLDLSIADGEFFALLGPSGCGKDHAAALQSPGWRR